mgnify:CR=1 FL=1
MSHLGRPKDGPTPKYSLIHIVGHLSKLLSVEVQFANDCIGEEAVNKAAALQPGQVLLLENLRFYKEEEKGDEAFAQKLSKLGDVYVNDAFGTAHRAHASTAVIAQFFAPGSKMFGLVMNAEVASAEKVLHGSEKPFTAIIGGAKVSDKILIIESHLPEFGHYVEEAYQKSVLERNHLDNIVSTRLKNISSICFGGSDLKTVFLGCLLGDKIATFKSEIAGLQPTHWNPIKLINKSFP